MKVNKKMYILVVGLLSTMVFWYLVTKALDVSKKSTIEVAAIEQDSKMTSVEKLIYLSSLKAKEDSRRAKELHDY